MCFLKSFKSLDTMPAQKEGIVGESVPEDNISNKKEQHSYLNSMLEAHTPVLVNRQDQMLFELLTSLNSNNAHLKTLEQNLSQSEVRLSSFCRQLNQALEEKRPIRSACDFSQISSAQTTPSDEEIATDPMVQKMFGKKHYEFRLELEGQTPTTIYKERNINLPLRLKTRNNQRVLNSNIIHLCLGVCDSNGEWVSHSKNQENFMKGKTEVEMYHGEGSFLKVYPREVSRGFPEGKLNFVIYAKPSVLQFSSNNSSIEKEVQSSLIEPLLIKDVTIKAKRRD